MNTIYFKHLYNKDIIQVDIGDQEDIKRYDNNEDYIEIPLSDLLDDISGSTIAMRGIKDELGEVIGIDGVRDYRDAIYNLVEGMYKDMVNLYKELEEEERKLYNEQQGKA